MSKKIKAALISVYYKDGLESIVRQLVKLGVTIYTTGGTREFIEKLGLPCIAVETLTSYPSILGGRVKTLHPLVFGGILGKRDDEGHLKEMKEYNIPEIDLVIVDLYPFEETVKNTTDEKMIIEKIDVGGPSMIRAAAKNYYDVLVVASKENYAGLETILTQQNGETELAERREFAAKAFNVCTGYDLAISNYFNATAFNNPFSNHKTVLRYGENPHQQATFYGDLKDNFDQLNGKELSYNNLVDIDAAINLSGEFAGTNDDCMFAIIKHTNVCGITLRDSVHEAWEAALACDPESAFGGVLITNKIIDKETALAVNELFFEVLLSPGYDPEALEILKSKKNRILLKQNKNQLPVQQIRSVLNGALAQQTDVGNFLEWNESGGRIASENEKENLRFANIICKHLKSNAIAIVKNKQLIGKGCGQTSRIDSLKQAIQKAGQFKFEIQDAVLASDAFFPFDDCVTIAHEAGVTAFIQPGGSIRDKDSIKYCVDNNLVMVLTAMRHFKH
ncbi:MAG: bifunctional phosphoribosylaminoimidazolecarboxamide formyltransferase/IMP cyclohydrolase [Chitinophagaceae bacterium]|nr:bifunctional phosphoribosylaminoimidazolecarboxamide formyltransferase/IMP cyclohydrolase [Chitinophagaceae bacterium]